MPGLIRGVARTAVVAGTATAVSGRVQRRQASKYADQDAATAAQREQAYEQQVYQQQPPPQQPVYQQPVYQEPVYQEPAPAAPAPLGDDAIEQLKQLAALRDQGILTEEEFATQKARILGM